MQMAIPTSSQQPYAARSHRMTTPSSSLWRCNCLSRCWPWNAAQDRAREVRQPMVAVALAVQPYIVLARPLRELGAHIVNCECPSLQLLVRTIKTLVLAIFRWHFCDEVLLPQTEGFYQSLNSRVQLTTRRELDAQFPHLYETALKLSTIQNAAHVTLAPDFNFRNIRAVTAQVVRDFFEQIYGMQITETRYGNTIYTLLTSPALTEAFI